MMAAFTARDIAMKIKPVLPEGTEIHALSKPGWVSLEFAAWGLKYHVVADVKRQGIDGSLLMSDTSTGSKPGLVLSGVLCAEGLDGLVKCLKAAALRHRRYKGNFYRGGEDAAIGPIAWPTQQG